MRAKSSEKLNTRNFLEKIESSIAEYPTSRLGPKLEKNKNSANLLNENFGANPKVPSSKNLLPKNNSSNKNQFAKSQNQIENNLSVLQRTKTEITGLSGSMMSITEQSTSSANDFNFNFDSCFPLIYVILNFLFWLNFERRVFSNDAIIFFFLSS